MQTKDQMQYMRRTPPQREAEETRRWRVGRHKSTYLCGVSEGGVSCSKLVLADVVSKERAESICRVYAIIDDQSNASLITSDLANE